MQPNQQQVRQVESYNYGEDSRDRQKLIGGSQAKNESIETNRKSLPTETRVTSTSPHPAIIRQANLNIEQSGSTQHNSVFYSQTHGVQEQGVSVFYNELSPGQIHRKSIEQLEYENAILLQQLQERDDVINMYKGGWKPENLPINDDIIKSLNLQLAQKNVLIEQFHRSLAQFEEVVRRESIQLSSIVVEQFHNLQTLIIRHEHYPILITQRLIETSKSAETIYIKDMTIIQEYVYKLEQSYKEVTILREKLVWFEREHHGMEQLIANLRAQIEQLQNQNKLTIQQEISVYQQQITVFKTEISQYQQNILVLQQEINSLRTQITQFQSAASNYQNEISSLKQHIAQLEAQLRNQSGLGGEIGNLKQQINVYITEINNYKQQIQQLQLENNNLKQQLRENGNNSNEIANLKQQINVYITEINTYKQQISTLTLANQQESARYLQQIEMLKSEIERLKGAQDNNARYLQQIEMLKSEIERLKGAQDNNARYLQQIEMLKSEIERLKNLPIPKVDGRELRELQEKIRIYEEEIRSLKRKIEDFNTSKFDSEWELDSLRRDNERLKGENSNLKKEVNRLEDEINRLNQEIISLKSKISRLENDSENSSYEWRIKYEESQTIIRRLKLEIEQLSIGGEWKSKYERLEKEYERLVDELERYKREYKDLQDKFSDSERTLRIEIERTLRGEWELKLKESNDKLKKSEDYVQSLLIKIQELEMLIERLREKPDNSEFENKIALLTQEIERLNLRIKELTQNLQEAEKYILELQEHIRNLEQNGSDEATIANLNITIEELTIEVKEYIIKIGEITRIKEEIEIKYKGLEQLFATTKAELELTIRRLNEEIALLKKELSEKSNGSKEWEKEKRELVEKYERELKERWEQLKKNEEYIAAYTKESQEIIAYLEQRIRDLEAQLENGGSGKDQYLYKIDARYEEIRSRLLAITSQTSSSFASETEYWEAYKLRRKQEIEQIQQTIHESLTFMSQIEQTIIVKREELYRLDFTNLDTVFGELERLAKGKSELDQAARQEFDSRLESVLKSVATTIHQ